MPEPLYIQTQVAIFQHHHGTAFDTKAVNAIYDRFLRQPPVGLDDPTSMVLFFQQHVAMETWFHTSGTGLAPAHALKLVEPFLQHDAFHVQVSAVRALSRRRTSG